MTNQGSRQWIKEMLTLFFKRRPSREDPIIRRVINDNSNITNNNNNTNDNNIEIQKKEKKKEKPARPPRRSGSLSKREQEPIKRKMLTTSGKLLYFNPQFRIAL